MVSCRRRRSSAVGSVVSSSFDVSSSLACRFCLDLRSVSAVAVCAAVSLLPAARVTSNDFASVCFAPIGEGQDSCRLNHAAKGSLSMSLAALLTTESRSGLSVLGPIGVQLRVSPDQRAGLRSRAAV